MFCALAIVKFAEPSFIFCSYSSCFRVRVFWFVSHATLTVQLYDVKQQHRSSTQCHLYQKQENNVSEP